MRRQEGRGERPRLLPDESAVLLRESVDDGSGSGHALHQLERGIRWSHVPGEWRLDFGEEFRSLEIEGRLIVALSSN